jgi:hypothetical protein
MTSDCIEHAINKAYDEHSRLIANLNRLREAEECVRAGVARFGGSTAVVCVPGFGVFVEWKFDLDDFRESASLIQFIEDWTPLGLQCVRTSDWAILGQRDYQFAHSKTADRIINLSCSLKSGSACKRVIKGYSQPEPIYGFECPELPA